MRMILVALAFAAGLGLFQGSGARAQAPSLTVADRIASRTYTQTQLLADPRGRSLTIADDPVYRRSMTYRVIAIADLLKGAAIGRDDSVQARAVDNFSVGIPAALMTATAPASPTLPSATSSLARPAACRRSSSARADVRSMRQAAAMTASCTAVSSGKRPSAAKLSASASPKSVARVSAMARHAGR